MRYIVTGASANFASGVLEISKDQAKSREHALENIGEGLYRVHFPVQFKRGEIVGFDGEVNKALLRIVEVIPVKDEDTTDQETSEPNLEEMDKAGLLQFARELGLNPHPNTGEVRLREMIHEEQDRMLETREGE